MRTGCLLCIVIKPSPQRGLGEPRLGLSAQHRVHSKPRCPPNGLKKHAEQKGFQSQENVLQVFEEGGEMFGSKSRKLKLGTGQAGVDQSRFTGSRVVRSPGRDADGGGERFERAFHRLVQYSLNIKIKLNYQILTISNCILYV